MPLITQDVPETESVAQLGRLPEETAQIIGAFNPEVGKLALYGTPREAVGKPHAGKVGEGPG